MLIQCLIPRRTGTPVTLGDGTKIAFQPNEQGDHVADVKEKDHIKQLLRHKGCYRPYNAEESRLEKEEAARKPQTTPGAENQNKDNPPPPITGPEKTGPGNEGTGGEGDKPLTEEQLNAMERDALADHFEKLTGKKPHHNAGKEKLVAAILAHHKTPAGSEGSAG